MWYVLVASVTPYEEYIKGGLMLDSVLKAEKVLVGWAFLSRAERG